VVEDRKGKGPKDWASFQGEVACLRKGLGVEAGCAQTIEGEAVTFARFAVGTAECEGMMEDLDSKVRQTVEPSC